MLNQVYPVSDHRDNANLIVAASSAGEYLERLAREGSGHSVTLSRDAALEIAEQMQRMAALLVVMHMSAFDAPKKAA